LSQGASEDEANLIVQRRSAAAAKIEVIEKGTAHAIWKFGTASAATVGSVLRKKQSEETDLFGKRRKGEAYLMEKGLNVKPFKRCRLIFHDWYRWQPVNILQN
jgi:hypothetical protein